MSHQHQRNGSNYQDPYLEPGAEYLATDKGSTTQGSYMDGQYDQGYGSYNNALPADKLDDDGVHALGEIAPGQRQTAGRAGLQNPTSSFAAMGPPPRSTGILREWRKEERGHQWGKVSSRSDDELTIRVVLAWPSCAWPSAVCRRPSS